MEPESRDPVRDGRAIREIGKLANAPASKGPARKPSAESSGFVDLAALMAQQPNWLDDALARAKGSSVPSLAPPSLLPLSAGSIAPTIHELGDERPEGVPSRSLPLLLASTGAGVLIAAACLFAFRATHPKAAPEPVQAVAVAHVDAPAHLDAPLIPPPPPVAPEATTAPQAEGTATVEQASADDDTTAAPSSSDSTTGRHHGRHGHHDARVAEARLAAPAQAETPAAAPAPRGAAPSGPRAGSALDAALRASVPASAPPAAAAPATAPAKAAPPPAAPAMDGRPERSLRQRGHERSHRGPPRRAKVRHTATMTDPSRALITFGGDGAVHKVDVSGPAGSNPKASQCMRSAFSRAHVPPFSQSTYAAGETVRP